MAASDITFRLKRGTAANLTALANSALLNVGEPYYITDQNRIAIGVTTTSFETFAKVSELASAGGGIKFTENETAPSSPAIGDMWLVPSTGTWYQRINGNSGQVWAEINSNAARGIRFTESETQPANAILGDIWVIPSTGRWYQQVTNATGAATWVEINSAAGVNSGSGTVVINFGNHPGSNEASVTVTGLSGISVSSLARANFSYTTLGNKTINDHKYASLLVNLMVGPITAGSGFTIYATCQEKIAGAFSLTYSWN